MSNPSIQALNQRFSRDNLIRIAEGCGGLACLQLQHQQAAAEIYLQGAHVTSYIPAGAENLLWMSQSTCFESGKALRGGIPLCWPWFGPGSTSPERPQHGFARNSVFELENTVADDESTRVTLRLDATSAPFPEWQSVADLSIEIRLSDQLWIELRSTNRSHHPIQISSALHAYYAVEDVRKTRIDTLHNLSYLDKNQAGVETRQTTEFSVSGAVDRVYLDAPRKLQLDDVGRKLCIESWGCGEFVVWNPWRELAAEMVDFDDHGYTRMLCVEPANAVDGGVTVNPGSTHRMGQCLKLTTVDTWHRLNRAVCGFRQTCTD